MIYGGFLQAKKANGEAQALDFEVWSEELDGTGGQYEIDVYIY